MELNEPGRQKLIHFHSPNLFAWREDVILSEIECLCSMTGSVNI